MLGGQCVRVVLLQGEDVRTGRGGEELEGAWVRGFFVGPEGGQRRADC